MNTTEARSDQPLVGAKPATAIKRAVLKTFTYSGRASRSEYWWYTAAFLAVGTSCFLRDFYRNRNQQDPEEQEVLPWPANQKLSGASSGVHKPKHLAEKQDLKTLFKPSALSYSLAFLGTLPYLSLSVRRLHDSNISGWWQLPIEVSGLGPYFYSRKPQLEGARFDR